MKRFREAALTLVVVGSLLVPVAGPPANGAECDDAAPPTAGIVRDGATPGVQRYDTAGSNTIAATWSDFTDDCGISEYQTLVSTVQGDTSFGAALTDWIPIEPSGGSGDVRVSGLRLDTKEVFTDWSAVAGGVLEGGPVGGWQQVAAASREDGMVLFLAGDRVVAYDGRRWRDLTHRVREAINVPGGGEPTWQDIGWNGSYWLLVGGVATTVGGFAPLMARLSEDLEGVEDLTSLVTPLVDDRFLLGVAWNARDGYWLLAGQDGTRGSNPDSCDWLRGYLLLFDGTGARDLGPQWPCEAGVNGWAGGGAFSVAYNPDDNSFLFGGGSPNVSGTWALLGGARLAYARSEWILGGSRKFQYLGYGPQRGGLPWSETICPSCLAWEPETKRWLIGAWAGLMNAATEAQVANPSPGSFADLTPQLSGWGARDRARSGAAAPPLATGEFLDLSHIARLPDGSWLVAGGVEGARSARGENPLSASLHPHGTALNRFRPPDLASGSDFEDLHQRLVGWDPDITDIVEIAPRPFAAQPFTFIVGVDQATGKVRVNVLGQRTYYVGVRAIDAAGHAGPIAWSPGQRITA